MFRSPSCRDSDHSMVFAYKKLALNVLSSGNNTVTYWNFTEEFRILEFLSFEFLST